MVYGLKLIEGADIKYKYTNKKNRVQKVYSYHLKNEDGRCKNFIVKTFNCNLQNYEN